MAAAIREARPGEEGEILAMYEWLFAPPGVKPPQWDPDKARGRLAEAIVSPRSTVFVAEDDQALIAFCTAYLELDSVRFGQRCWVEDFAVDPERRSQGVGAILLRAAREWAREAGATHLELDSGLARTDAHRFYEREGGSRQSYSFAWEL
ncbi:MAG TPA: GNAT family N-acetyltransferase [Solirubrobacterales bacterium]|jgi:GNAT superfamily N-acetyltransferase